MDVFHLSRIALMLYELNCYTAYYQFIFSKTCIHLWMLHLIIFHLMFGIILLFLLSHRARSSCDGNLQFHLFVPSSFFSKNFFIIYNIPHEITPITKNIFELKCVRSEPTVAVRQTDMNLGDNQNWTYRVVFCKCQWRWISMFSNFENEWPNK